MHVTSTFAVVSCEAEITESYSVFSPLLGYFSLSKPYQAPGADANSRAVLSSAEPETGALHAGLKGEVPDWTQGAASVPSEPALAGIQATGKSADDANTPGDNKGAQQQLSPSEKRKRKRKRKADAAPGAAEDLSLRQVREQEASARHAAVLPALCVSVSAFQAWLKDSGATTVAEAAAGRYSSQSASRSVQLPGALADGGEGCAHAANPATLKRAPTDAASSSVEPGAGGEPLNTGKLGVFLGVRAAEMKGREAARATHSASDCLPSTSECSPHHFDLIGLAELQAVLCPKFGFIQCHQAAQEQEPDGQQWPLFGHVIRNPDSCERVALAHDQEVLIPGQSRFLLGDAEQFKRLIPASGEEGFHCIVADPPWENKSASRGQKYPTMPSRRLLSLPVPQMLHQAGGLVVLWVTNRERLRRFVEQDMLPAWGLKILASWFWMKVTTRGELVGPLDITHRRPYEVILLAAPPGYSPVRPLPKNFIIFAVPGQHSRKPHLGRLLAPYLPPSPNCLELFARELAKGWTSCGNEVLAFQCLRFFKQKSTADVI